MITSMGDDSHVGLDNLHVDAVLLLPDDDRPPQFAILTLLLSAVGWYWIIRLTCPTFTGCIRV